MFLLPVVPLSPLCGGKGRCRATHVSWPIPHASSPDSRHDHRAFGRRSTVNIAHQRTRAVRGVLMQRDNHAPVETELRTLYDDYVAGHIGRRDFMRRAAALGAAGAAAATLGSLIAGTGTAEAAAQGAQAATAARTKIPLDVAEWSYMWVNVRRAD